MEALICLSVFVVVSSIWAYYTTKTDIVNQILRLPWQIESRRKSERHVEDRQTWFL